MRRSLACLPLLLASTAWAEDGPLAIPGDEPAAEPRPSEPAAPPLPGTYRSDPEWSGVLFRATQTARVGTALSIGGPLAILGGAVLAVDSRNFTLVSGGLVLGGAGVVGLLVGPPVLAGGSLRAHRALEEQGLRVDAAYGEATWALIGFQYGLAVVANVLGNDGQPGAAAAGVLSLGCYAGAIATGALQLAENRGAWYASQQAVTAVDLRVVPWTDGTNRGVAFALIF